MKNKGKIKLRGIIRGDITLIAEITGFCRKTVYNTLSGAQNNERVIEVAAALIAKRKARDLENISKSLKNCAQWKGR